MRPVRSVLPLTVVAACAAPVVVPPPTVAPAAAVAPVAVECADEAQAEKAFYEAQRLYQKKRYWEAAPGYVISYNFCRHPQVLCAAGQAYRKADKCEKSLEMLQKCLAGDVPQAARAQAQKLVAAAKSCEAVVTLRGDAAEEEAPDDAGFATQTWQAAGGTAGSGPTGAP